MGRRFEIDVQRAVDTKPDAPVVLAGFHVDVGGAACCGFAQGVGEEGDGGRAVGVGRDFGAARCQLRRWAGEG